jgi:UDPglucose--hexose-1-phosphate uridylyltransferase
MGLHQRPIPSQSEAEGQDQYDVAHLHLHFSPPLLRSASVRKFLVGLVLHLPAGIHIERTPVVLLFMRFELVGEPQRDLTAEQAAQRLRACATRHYLDGPENSE